MNKCRVKINEGYLVALPSCDPDYPGICLLYETKDKTLIDIVYAECKKENIVSVIDVYCYEDVTTEEFTRKYTLGLKEIDKALNGGR